MCAIRASSCRLPCVRRIDGMQLIEGGTMSNVRIVKRTVTAALLAVAVLAPAACKDDSTQPLTPTALMLISGDGQDATVGTAATSPLVVEVKDNDGNAMSNVV